MTISDSEISGNYKSKPILPSVIDVVFLKSIFDVINESHLAALRLNQSGDYRLNHEQTGDHEEYLNSYKVGISIITSNGQMTMTDSRTILDEKTLPEDIQRISINNNFYYFMKYRSQPPFAMDVVFDFRKPPFFDLTKDPVGSTKNESRIMVAGNERTWVGGVFSELSDMIDKKKSWSRWLHMKNVYAGILWLFLVPIWFWNFSKFDSLLFGLISKHSMVLVVGIYIYIFLISLFIFRAFFDYLKWVYPFMYLEGTSRAGARGHKIIVSTIAMGIFITAIVDLVYGVIKLLP